MTADKIVWMAAIPSSLDAIETHLYLGNIAASLDYSLLQFNNIKAVVSLTSQCHPFWESKDIRRLVPKQHHLCVQWAENATIDLVRRLPTICDFIDKHVQNGNVLVHCELGYSRSPAVVAGWLMRKYNIFPEEALARLNWRSKRKLSLDCNFTSQLHLWAEVNFEPFEIGGTVPKPAYDDWVSGRFVDMLGTSFKEETQLI